MIGPPPPGERARDAGDGDDGDEGVAVRADLLGAVPGDLGEERGDGPREVPAPARRRDDLREDEEEDVLARLLSGSQHTETRRGRVWNVQPVSAARAVKVYRCPGCTLDIEPGPQVGRLLDAIDEARAAGEVSTPDEAIDLARRRMASPPAEGGASTS